MERKSIGMLIAALRRANGLTQKQLADQLGVSDKAVSRWERDESLPDLMLLPVIADLFHITVDELLRGERRAQADGAAEAQANADPERLKRQTRRVLNAAFGRAHGRMLIGLGCGFAGLLTAMICNFAVMRALPGLVVGLLLCLAGAALLGAFAAAALRADAEEKYDAGALREYRVRVIASVKCIGMALLAMIALILPLAACLPGISAGYVDVWVQPEEWLRGAALCGALLGTAACLGLYLLNRRLAAEGLYSAARRHAHAWVAGILTAAMCLTLLIDAVTVNSSWMDNPDAWVNFTDFAAFQQWCEEQAANGKNEQSDENAGAQIAAYYYDENGNEVPIQEVSRATVYDPKSDYKRALGEINTAGLLGWTVYSAGDTVIFRGSTEELQAPIRAAYQTKLQIIRLLLCLEPLLALAAWILIAANYPSHARNGKK